MPKMEKTNHHWHFKNPFQKKLALKFQKIKISTTN